MSDSGMSDSDNGFSVLPGREGRYSRTALMGDLHTLPDPVTRDKHFAMFHVKLPHTPHTHHTIHPGEDAEFDHDIDRAFELIAKEVSTSPRPRHTTPHPDQIDLRMNDKVRMSSLMLVSRETAAWSTSRVRRRAFHVKPRPGRRRVLVDVCFT